MTCWAPNWPPVPVDTTPGSSACSCRAFLPFSGNCSICSELTTPDRELLSVVTECGLGRDLDLLGGDANLELWIESDVSGHGQSD